VTGFYLLSCFLIGCTKSFGIDQTFIFGDGQTGTLNLPTLYKSIDRPVNILRSFKFRVLIVKQQREWHLFIIQKGWITFIGKGHRYLSKKEKNKQGYKNQNLFQNNYN
jgi:hypothetical protein